MSAELGSALIAGGVSIVVAIASYIFQRQRLRAELRTEYMAEQTIRDLLRHKRWRLRTFDMIKRRIRGFSDDELRQKLVRAGAVSFMRRNGDSNEVVEWWGLRKRVKKELNLKDHEIEATEVAAPRADG